ncbi:hypothetical protein PILCRDRAFT_159937 [Piloderma croceum F 1598]|uniref:Uncharacterized protein n=1 Tax=Piloderma croceum (strain F 1598) TaxID=765440 RepID=A0A0C3BWT9_PILCF|nr:hypothetical protein PILCRDRAFT_159937 [Piloderma croceum F 1598]
MPPKIPGGEDAQPNERRLYRKGATNVPAIRLTTPRRTGRGTFQNRQSPRGSGPNYTNRAPQNPSHTSNRSQLFRGHVNYPEQYAPAHPYPGPSRHPAAPYPYTINSATQNPSKRSSSFSDARQPKRPRLEAPSQSRLDQPTSSKHTKKQLPKSRIEIKLALPLYCRKGVHGYHASRRAWLDREVQRIELERKLRVCNTQYLDREVLLYCSAEESQDLPARGDSLTKREEQVPRFNTPDVEQRLIDELSKEEDVQIDDCAPVPCQVSFQYTTDLTRFIDRPQSRILHTKI